MKTSKISGKKNGGLQQQPRGRLSSNGTDTSPKSIISRSSRSASRSNKTLKSNSSLAKKSSVSIQKGKMIVNNRALAVTDAYATNSAKPGHHRRNASILSQKLAENAKKNLYMGSSYGQQSMKSSSLSRRSIGGASTGEQNKRQIEVKKHLSKRVDAIKMLKNAAHRVGRAPREIIDTASEEEEAPIVNLVKPEPPTHRYNFSFAQADTRVMIQNQSDFEQQKDTQPMSPAWRKLKEAQDMHRRVESSGFRYKHQRQGSDSQPSHTMLSQGILSANVSLDQQMWQAAQSYDLSNLGMTENEEKSLKPNVPRRDVIASRNRHINQSSIASNSVRNIPPPGSQVMFPFAAYMPTLDSSATGFGTPLETQQRLKSSRVSEQSGSPQRPLLNNFHKMEALKKPSAISYHSLVQVGSPFQVTMNGDPENSAPPQEEITSTNYSPSKAELLNCEANGNSLMQTPAFDVTNLSRLSPTLKTKTNLFEVTQRLDRTNEEPLGQMRALGAQFYSQRLTESSNEVATSQSSVLIHPQQPAAVQGFAPVGLSAKSSSNNEYQDAKNSRKQFIFDTISLTENAISQQMQTKVQNRGTTSHEEQEEEEKDQLSAVRYCSEQDEALESPYNLNPSRSSSFYRSHVRNGHSRKSSQNQQSKKSIPFLGLTNLTNYGPTALEDTTNIVDDDDDLDIDNPTFRGMGNARTARDQFVSTLSRLRPKLNDYNSNPEYCSPAKRQTRLAELLTPMGYPRKAEPLKQITEESNDLIMTKESDHFAFSSVITRTFSTAAKNKFETEKKLKPDQEVEESFFSKGLQLFSAR